MQFSYPADFTLDMYYGIRSFAERYEDFKKLNAELVGLSIDSTFSHIRWIEWIQEKLGVGIPFL